MGFDRSSREQNQVEPIFFARTFPWRLQALAVAAQIPSSLWRRLALDALAIRVTASEAQVEIEGVIPIELAHTQSSGNVTTTEQTLACLSSPAYDESCITPRLPFRVVSGYQTYVTYSLSVKENSYLVLTHWCIILLNNSIAHSTEEPRTYILRRLD